MTECAALISTNPAGRERTGSVGLPVPRTEVEIRAEDGRPLPAGETGEVCARYLFLVDRKKDLIIRGGFNVYPRDVEDALVEHPAVQMAAVIGRPSTVHGEEVVAYVSLHDGAEIDAEQLLDWSRHRIGGYKYPREVHVIDAIPLTPVGKIDRKALRRRRNS